MTCGRGWFISALLLHFPSRDMNHLSTSLCREEGRAPASASEASLKDSDPNHHEQPARFPLLWQGRCLFRSRVVFPWLFALWRGYHISQGVPALSRTSPEHLSLTQEASLLFDGASWACVASCASLLCLPTCIHELVAPSRLCGLVAKWPELLKSFGSFLKS